MRPSLVLAALLAAPLTLAACANDAAPADDAAAVAEHNATPGHNPDGSHVEGDAAAGEHAEGEPAAGENAEAGGHDHGSPHGGTVKTAGGGHLELVVDGQTLTVYPLDGEEAGLPVAGIAGAQAIVQPASGSAQTVALEPMGDHLMGTVPAAMTAYTAIVTVPVAGETRSARFEVGLDGDTDHAH